MLEFFKICKSYTLPKSLFRIVDIEPVYQVSQCAFSLSGDRLRTLYPLLV